jgi:hypothetical protein
MADARRPMVTARGIRLHVLLPPSRCQDIVIMKHRSRSTISATRRKKLGNDIGMPLFLVLIIATLFGAIQLSFADKVLSQPWSDETTKGGCAEYREHHSRYMRMFEYFPNSDEYMEFENKCDYDVYFSLDGCYRGLGSTPVELKSGETRRIEFVNCLKVTGPHTR